MWVSCESCQVCSLSSSWSIGIYSQLIGFSLQWWIVPRVFFVWLQTTKSDEIWWNDLQLCRWDQFRGRPNEQRWAMRKSCVCFFWILHCKEVHEKRKTTRFQHSVLPFPEPRRRRLHLTSLGRKGVSMCFAFGLGLDVFCLFAFGQGRRRSATSEAGKTVEGKGGTREHTFQQIQAT